MKKLLISFIIASLFTLNTNAQSDNASYIFGSYDSRIGDYYGFGLRSEQFFIEFGLGGVMMNKVSSAIEQETGASKDYQKGYNWNLSAAYILGKKIDRGIYAGLAYTSAEYKWNTEFWPEPYHGYGKIVHGALDIISGYAFIKEKRVYIDARIGFGIPIITKEEIEWEGASYTYEEFANKLSSYLPEGQEIDYEAPSNMFAKVFFTLKLGYSF